MPLRPTDLLLVPPPTHGVASDAAQLPALPCTSDLLGVYPSSLPQVGATLAVHFACSCLQQDGGDALLICAHHALDDCPCLKLPASVNAATNDYTLARVKLKYMSSTTDLLRFSAAMHVLPQAPAAVVVLGLSKLQAAGGRLHQHRGQEAQLVHVMGLLAEGVRSLRAMSGKPVPLLVVDEATSGVSPKLFILQRWLPLCINMRLEAEGSAIPGPSGRPAAGGSGAGLCAFTLSFKASTRPGVSPSLPPALKAVLLHYTLHASHVELRAITWDNADNDAVVAGGVATGAEARMGGGWRSSFPD